MTINELGKILSQMYEEAPEGEKVTMIFLFSIRYAKIIHNNNYFANDILKHTKLKNGDQISDNYFAEINKGLKLAKYVVEKDAIVEFIKKQ